LIHEEEAKMHLLSGRKAVDKKEKSPISLLGPKSFGSSDERVANIISEMPGASELSAQELQRQMLLKAKKSKKTKKDKSGNDDD
jgi:hypothetical protein